MDFINEEDLRKKVSATDEVDELRDQSYSRDDLRFAFFSPFRYFCIDLISQFGFDLASITGKERKKALCPAIYYVYFVKRDGVHYLFALLDFPLGALNELRLRSCVSKGHVQM